MKRLILSLLLVCAMLSAHALTVSVRGMGEVPAEGLDLLITEAEHDLLTGKDVMELQGELLTAAPQLTVRIYRSVAGLTDEFCCADNCTAGNTLTEETKQFQPSGIATWYAHYTPQGSSDVTIRYVFDDGTDTRELRVRYTYTSQAVENTPADKAEHNGKCLRDGQLYILRDGQRYSVTGIR